METQGRLIVDLARLPDGGEDYEGELSPEASDLADVSNVCMPFGGVCYDVFVEQVDHELLVRGRVSQLFRGLCCRCGEKFDLNVEDPAYFADYPVEEAVAFVDLTPEMREAIILALPGYPVCREGCKGLCTRCGANLNREACSCGSVQAGSLGRIDLPDHVSIRRE